VALGSRSLHWSVCRRLAELVGARRVVRVRKGSERSAAHTGSACPSRPGHPPRACRCAPARTSVHGHTICAHARAGTRTHADARTSTHELGRMHAQGLRALAWMHEDVADAFSQNTFRPSPSSPEKHTCIAACARACNAHAYACVRECVRVRERDQARMRACVCRSAHVRCPAANKVEERYEPLLYLFEHA
jgi:hypothetical protein